MPAIPTYALYGEADAWSDGLHWETIQARSRTYGYRIAPHRHEHFFQILWIKGGRGEATLDGARFALTRQSVAVVPALTVHGYTFSEDVDGIVVTMMERDVTGLGIDVPPAEVMRGAAGLVAALDGLIAEADRPGSEHDLAMRAHLTLLLVSMRRASRRGAPDETGDRAVVHARAFRQMVDRQFRQTRRVGDYARALGISEAHLNRVCRQALGATPLMMIQRRIALEARRQLLFSDLSIKQIGAELGYDDPAYFTRFITRIFGAAPGAVRRAALSWRGPPPPPAPRAPRRAPPA